MTRYRENGDVRSLPEESDRRSLSPKVTSCDNGFISLAARIDTKLAEGLEAYPLWTIEGKIGGELTKHLGQVFVDHIDGLFSEGKGLKTRDVAVGILCRKVSLVSLHSHHTSNLKLRWVEICPKACLRVQMIR